MIATAFVGCLLIHNRLPFLKSNRSKGIADVILCFVLGIAEYVIVTPARPDYYYSLSDKTVSFLEGEWCSNLKVRERFQNENGYIAYIFSSDDPSYTAFLTANGQTLGTPVLGHFLREKKTFTFIPEDKSKMGSSSYAKDKDAQDIIYELGKSEDVMLWKCDKYYVNPTTNVLIARTGVGSSQKSATPTLAVVPQDPDTAFTSASQLYSQKRYSEAITLFETACAGKPNYCNNLGMFYKDALGVAQDSSRAADLFDRSCKAGNSTACGNLAGLYQSGKGVAMDYTRAAALNSMACGGGSAVRCENLAKQYYNGKGVRKDRSMAFGLFSKACDLGRAESCSQLGAAYLLGTDVKRDSSRFLALSSKGCDLGDSMGCASLGEAYGEGAGVALDRGKSLEFYRRACSMGDQNICAQLKRDSR